MQVSMLKLYARVNNMKNILEVMQDSGKVLSGKETTEAYYKLGEALMVIRGDRRRVKR